MQNETKWQLRMVAINLGLVNRLIKKVNENDIDDGTARALSKVKTAHLDLRRFL